MSFRDSARSPFTNDIVRLYNIRSESKGGSTTNTIGVNDITIPASPNFPSSDSGASTSYIVYLDYEIYRTSTNSTYFEVRNETQGVDLVIVDADVALSNYTCKFNPTNTNVRNAIEFNVGVGSNSAEDIISFKAQSAGGVLNAATLNTFVKGVSSIVLATTQTADYGQINADLIIKSTENASSHINAFITQLSDNGGGELKLLEGQYNSTTEIVMKSNVTLKGVGFGTHLVKNHSTIFIEAVSTDINISIEDLQVDGNSNAGDGINIAGNRSEVKRCWIHDNTEDGIQLGSDWSNIDKNYIYDNGDHGVNITGQYNKIISNELNNNTLNGIYLANENTVISNNNIFSNDDHGIGLISADKVTITGNDIYANSDNGIYIQSNVFRTTITGNSITDNSSYGIFVDSGQNINIMSNIIDNNDSDSTSQAFLNTNADSCLVLGNITSTNAGVGSPKIDDQGNNNTLSNNK